MKLLQELLNVFEQKESAAFAGYADVLKKHGFTKKNSYWISNNKKAGKLSFTRNGEWKLSGASIDGMVDDYVGTIATSLDRHLSKITESEKKHYIQSAGSRIAGPFDSEEEAEEYLDRLIRRSKPEDEIDDAHIVFEQKEKAWFSHDRKAWEKAVAKLHVDDDDENSAKCDGKTIARWYPDRDEGWVLTEAKNHLGETEYSSWTSWRAALKKQNPDYWIDGDKEIANAMVGPKPYKRGETTSIGEWDGEKGVVYK